MAYTLQDFINQYGNFAQVILKDHAGVLSVVNVVDVELSAPLFAEISSGNKIIVAAYVYPIDGPFPPRVPYLPGTATQQLQTAASKVEGLASRFANLEGVLSGIRDFLLNAPYTVNYRNIALPTPVYAGTISDADDPRLTDGITDFQTFAQGNSINIDRVRSSFFRVLQPNMEATIIIPLPDLAKLPDFRSLSINALHEAAGTTPNTVEMTISIKSRISALPYDLDYVVTGAIVPPVPGSDSYLSVDLNLMQYVLTDLGLGPTIGGEPIANFDIHTVKFVFTTTSSVDVSYIDECSLYVKLASPFTPISGTGLTGQVTVWSGDYTITGFTDLTYLSGVLKNQGIIETGTSVKFPDATQQITAKRTYWTDIGDSVATQFTLTHAFGTKNVYVVLLDILDSYREIEAEVLHPSDSTIQISFTRPPAASSVRVVVLV